MQRRLTELDTAQTWVHLAQTGTGGPESRTSFSAQTLREALRRAGLTGVDRVGPASVAGWAGVQVLAATGRIDAVALALGVRSLDAAARLIDWDWHTTDVGADG